jgi:hypothetical protein
MFPYFSHGPGVCTLHHLPHGVVAALRASALPLGRGSSDASMTIWKLVDFMVVFHGEFVVIFHGDVIGKE